MLDPVTIRINRDEEIDADLLAKSKMLCFSSFGNRFKASDWEHTLGGTRVLLFEGAELLGHAAIVPRCIHINDEEFNVGYVEGVAIRTGKQRVGSGTKIMQEVATHLFDQFDLGVLYTLHPTFYTRLGWEHWAGPSFVLQRTNLVRTPDDDTGLMVLRPAKLAGLSLTESITCHERDGDDW
jgi:aminoglycoside 2'-N-acetyltransferase I